jgi:hypothetical protein
METINNESEQKVEEANKEIPTETTTANSNDGELISRAEKINSEMKKQNEIKAKLLEREEKLLARQETLRALGGGSPVGQKVEPHIETPTEYADRIMKNKL